MRAAVAGIDDRDAERRGCRTTFGRAGQNDGFTLAVLFSRMASRWSHDPVEHRAAACLEGSAACGCESLISKMALSAISIQNRAEVRKRAVGRGL
jgi:hypothetical protein